LNTVEYTIVILEKRFRIMVNFDSYKSVNPVLLGTDSILISGMLDNELNYLLANKADTLALVFDGKMLGQEDNNVNVLIVNKQFVINNLFDFSVALMLLHEGFSEKDENNHCKMNGNKQPKTRNIRARPAYERLYKVFEIKASEYSLDTYYWLTLEGLNYKDYKKSSNTTRSDSIEKAICKKLGYKWQGELVGSHNFDVDGNKLFDRALDGIKADGYKKINGVITSRLEVKCVRGRIADK
jgi:hypothetical protein